MNKKTILKLLEAEIDSKAEGSFPHMFPTGTCIVLGVFILFYNVMCHFNEYDLRVRSIGSDYVLIWLYLSIVIILLDVFYLIYRLPNDRIELHETDGFLQLKVIKQYNIDKLYSVNQFNYWWNYGELLFSNTNYPVNYDADMGSKSSGDLSGTGAPMNIVCLYVEIISELGAIVLLEKDSFWDGSPKWKYEKRKLEVEAVECFKLPKLVEAIENHKTFSE